MLTIELTMTPIALTESDMAKYGQFVAQNDGSFLQSWDWGNWQEQLGKKVHRFLVMDNGQTIAAAQIIEAALPYYGSYLYLPYGPVFVERGAWSVEQVFSVLINGLQKQFPKSIFIRLEPTTPYNLLPTTYSLQPTKHIQPGKTLVLDLIKTEEQLLAEMHPKTRYNIKVAQKHGVTITVRDSLSEEAKTLIVQTASRQNYKSQPQKYFTRLTNFFRNEGSPRQIETKVYEAVYNNQLLAVAIIIDFGKTRTYLFGGSSDEHKNVMSRYLLHWQAILEAKLAGKATYDFWGIETAKGETPGFVRFKLGFGGNEIQYPPCVDITNQTLTYRIYGLLRRFA
jgi:peptidoglycan pentaglycine glycine transferase (the first glycine)